MPKMSRGTGLPAALSGTRLEFAGRSGQLGFYVAEEGAADRLQSAHPMLLIHSVNAAGSAYETRPIYEHYRKSRIVYALDLPGFGFSSRPARRYTARLMTDAVHDMLAEISRRRGDVPVDALAISLSCEFLARAAAECPKAFRSLALVSPTGFSKDAPFYDPPGTTRGMPWLYAALSAGGAPLYTLLTSRISIRHYLRKTWGSTQIDLGLLDYDYQTTHQQGAHHAPYDFVSGYLFSKDISTIYDQLALPVWLSHGVRGDFIDYSKTGLVAGRSNWTKTIFPTGALPHFEAIDEFTRAFDSFLSRSDAA